jgi:hypothetical protein
MRQGRRINTNPRAGQALVKTLIAVLVVVAGVAAVIWWANLRNPTPPPLSSSEKSAGIHRMQPPGDSGVNPVDIGDETEVTNVWVTQIEADGKTRLAVTTPQGREDISLRQGQELTVMGVTLKLVRVHDPGGRGAYADGQIDI